MHLKIMKVLNTFATFYDSNSTSYRELVTVIGFFPSIGHAQTALEAFNKPIMMKVLPMLADMKSKLYILSSCFSDRNTHKHPSDHVKSLSKATFDALDQIKYHDLWSASCVRHQGPL